MASGAWVPLVLLALAVSAPVASNIHFGQVSLFVTTASAVTFLAGRSGIWAGLAAVVKLTPLTLIPALLAWRRRTAVVALVTFAVATAVGWFLLPAESVRYWLRDLPGGSRYGDTALAENQSILGLLARHPIGHQTWVYLGLAAAVATIGTWRAVRHMHAGSRLAAFVIASGVALLIAPVSWTHHEIPAVLALFCITARTPPPGLAAAREHPARHDGQPVHAGHPPRCRIVAPERDPSPPHRPPRPGLPLPPTDPSSNSGMSGRQPSPKTRHERAIGYLWVKETSVR